MATRIQLRRDTSSNWATNNPTLASGEFGIETDTNKFKIGDGTTSWNSLSYASFVADFGTAVTVATGFGATATTGTSGTLARSDHSHGSPSWIAGNGIDFTGNTASVKVISGSGLNVSSSGVTVDFGTTAGKVAQGNDSRFTFSDSTSSTSSATAATSKAVNDVAVAAAAAQSTANTAYASAISAYSLANSAIPQSIVDAKGDLIVGSANDTVVKVGPIGADGTVLTADAASTGGMKWATAATSSAVTTGKAIAMSIVFGG